MFFFSTPRPNIHMSYSYHFLVVLHKFHFFVLIKNPRLPPSQDIVKHRILYIYEYKSSFSETTNMLETIQHINNQESLYFVFPTSELGFTLLPLKETYI